MRHLRDTWTILLLISLSAYISALLKFPEPHDSLLHRLATPVVAALLASLAYRLFTRTDAQRRDDLAYTGAWRAVLLELSNALSRMKDLSEYRLEHRDLMRLFQIRLVTGIRLAYFQLQRHPQCAMKIYGIYNSIEHFQDGHAQALKYMDLGKASTVADQRLLYFRLSEMWMDRAGLWVGQHRHHLMVDELMLLIDDYNRFSERAGLASLRLGEISPEKLLPKYWERE